MRIWLKKTNETIEGSDAGDPAQPQDRTILGPSWQIKGRIYGKGQVVLGGVFEGELEIQGKLTVDPTAKLKGTFRSEKIRIRGTLEGDLDCARMVTLGSTARVDGDVTAPRLQMENGAWLKGRISMENRQTFSKGK